LEAKYLALGVANIITTLSPQRIILGGGVMKKKLLYSLIRKGVRDNLNSYVKLPGKKVKDLSDYIVAPTLGDLAGVKGAIALAIDVNK
jgi:fructokinase